MHTTHRYKFALWPRKTISGKVVWLDYYVEHVRFIYGPGTPVKLKTLYAKHDWTIKLLKADN